MMCSVRKVCKRYIRYLSTEFYFIFKDIVKEMQIITVLNSAARIIASDIVIANKQVTNAEKKLSKSSLDDLCAVRSIVGTSTVRVCNEIVPVY